ncbi:MAG: glycosyltransferase family 2 protein [Candidatus Cryptobacteroides sp.]
MISIIVPVYNSASFLDKCISSVVSQTSRDIEILLIDDGSTDGSGEICESWSKIDSRINVIHQDNSGVSAARNRGIEAARGEFIMFLDSDDAICPDSCYRLETYQKEHNSDCVVFGAFQDSGTVWMLQNEIEYNCLFDFQKDFVRLLETELLSPVWNKLYKKDYIKHKFIESMSFGEDLVFCLDYISQCNKINFVPWSCYLHNNLNEYSITHTFRINQINDIEQWRTSILDFAENNDCSEGLFSKYVKDVMLWLKRFYASNEYKRRFKKKFIKQWYEHSYLREISAISRLPYSDLFILRCLQWQLWLLPYFILRIKHIFK